MIFQPETQGEVFQPNQKPTFQPDTTGEETVDESGWGSFLGSIIGGGAAALMTSFSGPGSLVAAAGGSALGSVIGTLADEMVVDYKNGHDWKISKSEFINALKNGGVDFVLTATGGILFKGAAAAAMRIPVVSTVVKWIANKAGVSVQHRVREAFAKVTEVSEGVTKEMVRRMGSKGDLGEFLPLVGEAYYQTWRKLILDKPKVAEKVLQTYQDLWSNSYRLAAKDLKKLGNEKSNLALISTGYGKEITPTQMAKRLDELADDIKAGKETSEDLYYEVAGWSDDVINMIDFHAKPALDKFLKYLNSFEPWKKVWDSLAAVGTGQLIEGKAEDNLSSLPISANRGSLIDRTPTRQYWSKGGRTLICK